ncbi:hypothetical protein Hanom_Chr07g00676351 [Helianthus anomalus]
MDRSTPISRVGFSDDRLTDTLMTLVWIVGVRWREMREGKCFSSIPAPRSFKRVSFTSRITSHLKMKRFLISFLWFSSRN